MTNSHLYRVPLHTLPQFSLVIYVRVLFLPLNNGCYFFVSKIANRSSHVIKSAFTPSPFIIMRHGGLAEPLDCSTPALDLCVRPKRRTPTPEEVYMKNRTESLCLEPPSSSVCFSSPGSQDSSEYSESSLNAESSQLISTTHIPKTKLPRPFKAYPKDPLSIAIGVVSTETLLGQNFG
ncbi:thyrotroph embryonic factor related [Holotrichia oblita]|uniref:Thyrotroph embryonic factor related n=1 Tax=Holotrichia oblita TaxID=644536 RepID=A0ACB9TBH3_HOLOL|nr:thyrotroph embryonic factor related [Holotrichia oblita]